MKKIIILFGALSFCLFASAQNNGNIWSKHEVFRITLKEKLNIPMRMMPVELIRAYCEGSIRAFYPLDTMKECSYHEFIAHFNTGVNQPTEGKGEFSPVPCPALFCKSNDVSMLENFLVYIDLYQTKRFDKNKSMEVSDVKYVQLKYVYMKHDLEVVLDGPVFRYSDIAALAKNYPNQYLIPNAKNVAGNHTIKKVVDSRMFNGIVLGKYKPFEHKKDERKQNEKDVWHH